MCAWYYPRAYFLAAARAFASSEDSILSNTIQEKMKLFNQVINNKQLLDICRSSNVINEIFNNHEGINCFALPNCNASRAEEVFLIILEIR